MTATITFNGITLPCEDISDQHKAAIVRHQYAGQSGAELEFLGMDAGETRLRCVFNGREELAHYRSILDVMRAGEAVLVSHPFLGEFSSLLSESSCKWDDRIDCGSVDFTVIESGLNRTFEYRPRAIQLRVELTSQVLSNTCDDWSSPFHPDSAPEADLSDPTWAEKINALGLGNKVSALVAQVKTGLGRVDALTAAITSPVSAAFNALEFGSTLPWQVAKRIMALLDLMGGRIEGAPDPVESCMRFVADVRSLALQFRGGPLAGMVQVLGAMQVAGTAASIMDADEQRLRAQIALEESETFDARGNWIGRAIQPGQMPATPDQVGKMVVAVRTLISEALPMISDGAAMERMALALQDQYRDRLVEFEQLVEIDVPQPMPLHLICVRHGLPYNTAERLVRLNNIRNPSFVSGRIRIYAA